MFINFLIAITTAWVSPEVFEQKVPHPFKKVRKLREGKVK